MKKSLVLLALVASGVSAASAAAQSAPVSTATSGSVEERLDQLERIIDARNAAQMRLLNDVQGLKDEVAELRGVTEEHAYQLEQLLQRQREIYQEIDRRLATKSSSGSQSSESASTTAVTTQQPLAEAGNYSDNLNENEAYDQAIRLVLEEKQYEQAIPAFESFIEQFPESSYTPNAYYWLGQLRFAAGNYERAKIAFQAVVDDFPDSNKRGDCLLKLGTIAEQEGNQSGAREYLETVVSEYPDSTEAGLARQRLNAL